ncbi:type 2 isopentenyl-diphosphate Delta-isomerase [Alteribacillus sp. YIM 98480]|uniref:type 2 isopentenyl-diphosphate Delta-isomerase n=1 Tax=Alteribacillus sp. YIM 98480 TaxID=2606599 RepID=UPI00131D59B2|nr:type 2 isopentenyl-diphosphate Delta-isomerase [Alteribacillus sp. YIM 98480]
MSRAERKKDHINYALSAETKTKNSFDDVRFVHNSLPETSVSQIDQFVSIGELCLSSPIIINAMTGGGGKETERMNECLAAAARDTGAAMAVGSQMAAFKDPAEERTYNVVRKVNKDGVIFANLGSELTLEQAKQAVDMVDANALQIHLNVIQELVMPEGDRDFNGALETISEIAASLHVPVIIKEVGFGLSYEAVTQLKQTNVQVVDTGGNGGTNFAEIENKRRNEPFEFFNKWGLAAVPSIVESVHAASRSISVIGSGGVRNGYDIAKAIALGADAAGMAGKVLAAADQGGKEGAKRFINKCQEELKMIMTAVGAKRISDLKNAPLVLTGESNHWLEERGFPPSYYSRKRLGK